MSTLSTSIYIFGFYVKKDITSGATFWDTKYDQIECLAWQSYKQNIKFLSKRGIIILME